MRLLPGTDSILEIHRGPDGYVRFFTGTPEGEPSPLMSISLKEPGQRRLADLLESLSVDAWMSMNTFWRSDTTKAKDLRYLNACFVDCDYYRQSSLDFPGAVSTVLRAQEQGYIPPATLLVNSGRGLWVVYLLASEPTSRTPPRAWRESVDFYRRIQAALHALFQQYLPELGADHNASDPSRITRVPGSLNSRSGRVVEYLFQADREGGFTYTLETLGKWLGVTPSASRARSQLREAFPCPQRRKGWLRLAQSRIRDLDTLRTLRGGIPEGTRDFHLYFMGILLRQLGANDRQMQAELLRLFGECQQPPTARHRFTREEALSKVEASRNWKRFTNKELISRLAITPREAERLCSIRQEEPGEHEPKLSREERTMLRRAKILELLAELPDAKALGSRGMAKVLSEQGIRISHAAVAKDYLALGLRPSRPSPS